MLKDWTTYPLVDEDVHKIECAILRSKDKFCLRDFIMFRITCALGLRPRELITLKKENINLKDKVLIVRHKYVKQKRTLYYRLSEELIFLLKLWLSKSPLKGGYLFPSSMRNYDHITSHGVYLTFLKYFKLAGISEVKEVMNRSYGEDIVKAKYQKKRFYDTRAYCFIKLKELNPKASLLDLTMATGHMTTQALENFYIRKGVTTLKVQDSLNRNI